MNNYKADVLEKKYRAPLYLDLVQRIAQESYCVRLQVGALIEKDGNIISFGFNGRVSKAPNVCELEIPEEIWKDTLAEGYQVSSLGRVKRLSKDICKTFQNKSKLQTQEIQLKEHILNPSLSRKGYPTVKLKEKSYPVHRLIALAFISNNEPNYFNQVNHIDGEKSNNNVNNLEWCTNRYNCEDRSRRKFTERALPMGVYLDSSDGRKKNPYRAQIYFNNKLMTQRFSNVEDCVNYINKFKSEKEYQTIRYNPANDLITLDEVLHAESNAITKACKSPISTEGATIYCTHSCCVHCAKLIVQSGIVRFVYLEDYRDSKGVKFLQDCGIEVIKATKKV